MVKILGIDPGLQRTGWGIVQSTGNSLSYIGHGVVQTNAKLTLAERLNMLHQELIKQFNSFKQNRACKMIG